MQDIKTQWEASIPSKKLGEPLNSDLGKGFYDRAKHIMRFFAFRASTPSAAVSSEMQSAFFNCGTQGPPLPIVSSAGIRSALDVRMPNRTISAFLPGLPVFPEELLGDSKLMIAALQEKGMLSAITFADVVKGLREWPLSEGEMTACLRWWTDEFRSDPSIGSHGQLLLDAAVFTVCTPDNGKREVPLKGIQTFLGPKNIIVLTDGPLGPLPDHLLPITISRELDLTLLQESLQWRELSVLEWVQHLTDPAVYTQKGEFNIVESPVWADRVLQIIGKCWPNLPEVDRTAIGGLLGELPCIPTSAGMKMPSEAYFSSKEILDDLPVVNLPSQVQIEGNLKGMLADLGVRKHVELRVIFDR